MSLAWEMQQETGSGNLNSSLFSQPVSTERKRNFLLVLPAPKRFSNVTGQALISLNLEDDGEFGTHQVLCAQLLLRLLSYGASPTLCRLQAARKEPGILLKS